MRSRSLFVVAVLGLASCGSPQNTEIPPAVAPEPVDDALPCASPDDLDAIRDLLQSGLPAYDYEPADSLAELAGWVDAVITGTVDSAVRDQGVGEEPTTTATLISVSDVEVIAGVGEVTVLAQSSGWNERDLPDPLESSVTFDDLQFVAFVAQADDGSWLPWVDGMVLGCADAGGPVVPFIAMPPGMENLTIEEAIDVARTVASDPGAAVDGPVVRYPVSPATEGGEDAEISGTLELDGDCLYVALDEVGERYPMVWPNGTNWDPTDMAVLLPSGDTVSVGSDVTGGGGYASVDTLESIVGADGVALLARCVDNEFGEIAVVNNLPDAIGSA